MKIQDTDFKDLIQNLSRLRAITPSDRFKSRVRNALIPSLPVKPGFNRSLFFGFYTRLAVLLVVFILLGSSGMVLAAGGSKPGSPLYPIKQVLQDIKVAVSNNPQTKATLHLEKGEDKIEELKQAAQHGDNIKANNSANDYERDVNNALNETQTLGQQNTETAETINHTLEKHTQTLEQVKDQVPSPAQAAINKAITVSEKGQQQAQEVIQNNPSGNNLPTTILPTITPQPEQNHPDDPGSSSNQDQNKPTIQLPTQAQNNQNNNNEFGLNKAEENKKK